MSCVFVLSAEVDVRYALFADVSTNSDLCVPTLCGGIPVNTGCFAMPLHATEHKCHAFLLSVQESPCVML